MNSSSPFAVGYLVLSTLLVFFLPRRRVWAAYLITAWYMSMVPLLVVGPAGFSVIRILVVAGFARLVVTRERILSPWQGIDTLVCLWGVWYLFSGLYFLGTEMGMVFRLGAVGDMAGTYFLFRVYVADHLDYRALVRTLAVALVPVAVFMLVERFVMFNAFSLLGGVSAVPAVRQGVVRAQGPFAHPILAGTVGAVCLPMMAGIWGDRRLIAVSGTLACLAMVFASGSSGPILSLVAGLGGLYLWRWRHEVKKLVAMAVAAIVALDLVMKAPVYYLMARVGVFGASTGWHRARLMESASERLHEWWFVGTDYTRHWMPTGVSWSPNHTDITNFYLSFGVRGGLPLMLLFIAAVVLGMALVVRVAADRAVPQRLAFEVWSVGSSLFAIAVTGFSVSFFDQSRLLVYVVLAVIASFGALPSGGAVASGTSRSRGDDRPVPRPSPFAVPSSE